MSDLMRTIATRTVLDMETLRVLETEGYPYAGALDLAEGDPAAGAQGTPGSDNGGDGAGGNGGGDEPYLVVDDRTRYNTREDAIRGYQEAGRRITELTPWQQSAWEYGLTDPRQIGPLLDELIQLRAQGSRGASTGGGNQSQRTEGGNANANGSQGTGAPTTEAERAKAAAIKWLSENGEAAGLVSKEVADQLRERVEAFDTFMQRADDERFQQRVDFGHGYLNQQLQTLGVMPTDANVAGKFHEFVANALTTWINADDQRIAAFNEGGRADLEQLIATGLQDIMPILNVLKNQAAATTAGARASAQPNVRRATAPPNRSAQGNGNGANGNGNGTNGRNAQGQFVKQNRMDTGEDFTPEVHEAAWAAMERARAGGR